METAYIWVLLAGFGGGIIRGVVGFIKYQFRFKNVEFRPWYFSGMMLLSGIVGLLTAISVKEAGIGFLGVDVPKKFNPQSLTLRCAFNEPRNIRKDEFVINT